MISIKNIENDFEVFLVFDGYNIDCEWRKNESSGSSIVQHYGIWRNYIDKYYPKNKDAILNWDI